MADTMEPLVPSTPSPGPTSRIRTPPAPQHGFSDSYEPYSPRKSKRIAQRAANRTPSPPPSRLCSSRQNNESSLASPKSTKKPFIPNMATPALSPQKKRMPPIDPSRRASGTLTAEGTAHAAVALGLSPAPKSESLSARRGATAGAGMLITPAKTPQKPPNDKVKAKVKSVARNLFHTDEEDIMASPRKARTETHNNPDSFYSGELAETSFEIFTDSHERIPEVDDSADNPFYVSPQKPPAPPEPPRRRSKRNTVTIPGEGKVSIDEAVRREDGMLIVFRGKKQFRKFTDMDERSTREGLDEGDGGLESAVESPTKRHFTRSSIKPRLLFPTDKSDEPAKVANEDEEAATDIEEHVLAGLEADKPETPGDMIDEAPATPAAPRYAPASPPTTARTTRSGTKKAAELTPKPPKPPAKRSPFDSWRRVKGGSQTTGHKRSGDDLSTTAPKRTRA
ncbi:hypothetical protein MYCTH_2134725 [Thermothelomyces thermophilus ATCC 42464]|uniref:Uncharacterized protein n=1 Tax=Thermothelomyces thermophilus (strain ATCC 42464 / BCRC 31852 / DSM 1799) TaxID=573729 RepID=G2QEV7_THET4|nr:uncharacterized protein MYCTH_2134725 [Thermothelomyces thermophilus ATCC 42464]AEO58986.1 hypothetical protein MYCTH_2134725 [Thermothelomyces thermophilus ATCC 42464]